MFVKIGRAWRRVRKYPHCIVFFVPSRKVGGSKDPVETMWSSLPGLLKGVPRCVRMLKKASDFATARLQAMVKHVPREVVLFAHPSSTWSGFAVNPADESTDEALLSEWWLISNHRFKRLVAHVCYGARILGTEPWQGVFPSWLSYKEDIHALQSTESDRKMWAELGKAVVDATVESKTIQALAYRLRAAYFMKMAELKDCSSDGTDALHAIHLQMLIDGLKTSED